MPSLLVLDALEVLGGYTDYLVWAAMLAFLAGAVLEVTDHRDLAVPVAAGGWLLFGLYWLGLFPYYYLEAPSPLQAVATLLALPLAAYVAYLLVTGRDSLLVVSRAVACMGLIYLPVATIDPVRTWLIETVAVHTQWGMQPFGYDPVIEEGANGYQSRFDFEPYTGEEYSTYIVLACTGIGAISVFGGLIASVRAPLRRKALGVAAATSIIYLANIARNVFVGLAAPLRWFDYPALETVTATLAGEGSRTSFFVAHTLVAQTLSVVALIAITLLVIRIVPEVIAPIEEVLSVLAGDDVDLSGAVGHPAATNAAAGVDAASGSTGGDVATQGPGGDSSRETPGGGSASGTDSTPADPTKDASTRDDVDGDPSPRTDGGDD